MGKKGIIDYQKACVNMAREFCERYGLMEKSISFETMDMKFIEFGDRVFRIKLRDMYFALDNNVQREVCDKWLGKNYRAWFEYGIYIPLKEFINE